MLMLSLLLFPVANVDVGSPGADAGGSCRGGRLISSDGGWLMCFHLTHQSCHGGRLISSDRGCECAVAVLAALAVVNIDVGSHGADAVGPCCGGRLIYSDGGGECGWMLGMSKLASNSKGGGMSGGFFGGRMLLGPNPSCQLLIFAASQHFFIKARKPAFLSAGILSLVTWLVTLVQLP